MTAIPDVVLSLHMTDTLAEGKQGGYMSIEWVSKRVKGFQPRAAKASEKITGKGYSTITDEALKPYPQSRSVPY